MGTEPNEFDPAKVDYEAEYNNRVLVPDNGKYGARWADASAITRANLDAELDLPYGPGIRNRYDLFRTARRSMATPLAVYIHGGVWQRGDRKDYSVVANELVARGVDVALPSYTLCPEAKVADIFEELRAFLRALWRKTGRRPVVVGHSVGGNMAAAMLATDWSKLGDVPDDLVRCAYSISGVFEVEPYVHTTYNIAVRINVEEARKVSPALWQAPKGRTLVAAVGGAESREFVRQSIDIAGRWSEAGVKAECVIVPGGNHFSVVDELCRPDSAMLDRVVGLAEAAAGSRN
jgi:arylformamidase